MPEWLVGVAGSIAGVALVALLGALTKRANLYHRSYLVGSRLRALGLGYDLPVIGGDAETKLKDMLLSTVSDFFRGIARGLAGKPEVEDSNPLAGATPVSGGAES